MSLNEAGLGSIQKTCTSVKPARTLAETLYLIAAELNIGIIIIIKV